MFSNEIANGIEYLDEKYTGWEHRVNLDTLKLSDCNYCVLGQLGVYFEELDKQDVEDRYSWAKEHGFTVKLVNCSNPWPILTRQWKTAIKKVRVRESTEAKIF